MNPQAVLFDLDDTLVDFQYSRRQGLRAVQDLIPALAHVPVEDLELAHERQLQAYYLLTLDGKIEDDKARLERFRCIFSQYDLHPNESQVAEASVRYSRTQKSNARLVPGIRELLPLLRKQVKIGIVTNGRSDVQREKLARLGISREDLDALAISEEVGGAKPDFAIFQHALDELEAVPDRAFMIGDSWYNDIVPAMRMGIKPIWLNRYGLSCPDPIGAVEIGGFLPVAEFMTLVFS